VRLSAYDVRQAVIDPAYRLPPPGAQRAGPSTTSSLRKAVRAYHERGVDEARESLRQSLSNYFARPGAPSTQAAHARQALETYIRTAAEDSRPAFVPRVRVDADLGGDTFGADVDVVLLDPGGYVGRLLLLGPLPELTTAQLEVIAFGPTAGLIEEFDDASVVGVDVWETRRDRVTHVPAAAAIARRADVRRILDRLVE
jgi:hypothetical protein